MDYLSFADPRGIEGWVGLDGWPIVDSSPTIDQAQGRESPQSAGQRPTSWLLNYAVSWREFAEHLRHWAFSVAGLASWNSVLDRLHDPTVSSDSLGNCLKWNHLLAILHSLHSWWSGDFALYSITVDTEIDILLHTLSHYSSFKNRCFLQCNIPTLIDLALEKLLACAVITCSINWLKSSKRTNQSKTFSMPCSLCVAGLVSW